jgi:ABC-type branched-subunit amino acid transport system substrate-binding protein
VTDGPQVVERIGADTAKGLAVTQVVPDPNARSIPLIREIQENHKKFAAKDAVLNHTMIEGYIAAKILCEGLKRAGANPTRKKLRDTLESMREYDIGGQYIAFSPSSHSGMNYVDITILNREGKLLR